MDSQYNVIGLSQVCINSFHLFNVRIIKGGCLIVLYGGAFKSQDIKPIHCKWQRVTQVDVSLETSKTSGFLRVSSVECPTWSPIESVYVEKLGDKSLFLLFYPEKSVITQYACTEKQRSRSSLNLLRRRPNNTSLCKIQVTDGKLLLWH